MGVKISNVFTVDVTFASGAEGKGGGRQKNGRRVFLVESSTEEPKETGESERLVPELGSEECGGTMFPKNCSWEVESHDPFVVSLHVLPP